MISSISPVGKVLVEYSRLVKLYSQTIVKEGIDDFDGETCGTVEAVPFRIIRWTRVHVECDIRSRRRRRWPWLRRRPR